MNAQLRNRGSTRLPVRGRAKVRCVALLLFALAHNLWRTVALAPQWLGLHPNCVRSAGGGGMTGEARPNKACADRQ